MIVNDFNINSSLSSKPPYTGKFQLGSDTKESNAVSFFELLYSYPSKFKIKWNALDELKEDLFLPSNYDVLEHSLPFIDYIDDWLFSGIEEEIKSNNAYASEDFREGFFDKRISSNFYSKQTKSIQNTLASVPIYVILNGLDEVVLNKPRNLNANKNGNNILKKVIYDYCGAFDSSLEKRQQVGFFFMNRLDAETYLREVARSDMNGTEIVGLSVHCIGLDSAYNITREHHPGIDFRIIPDLQEVKDLLTKKISKSSFIVEDEQQQLRFRRRNVNIFPVLGRLGQFLSPTSSFLQRNEYFKGVPIYIVQTFKQSSKFPVSQLLNFTGLIDTVHGRFIQCSDILLGCGHNWIMQGSLQDAGCSNQFTNYVFFDEVSATKFINNSKQKIARYKGSRASNLEYLVRKPKIFVYNLEDFIELWEESIQQTISAEDLSNERKTIFEAEHTIFIPSKSNYKEVQNFLESEESTTLNRFAKTFVKTLTVKYNVFKNFVGLLFSVGYD